MNKIPLKSDWKIDAEKMTAESTRTKSATILANPNAPTGIAMTRNEIDAMVKNSPRDKIFVVDEAYADFGEESCIPLLKTHENLVIVRTFSKSLSFAGMRLGFVVANPKIISALFTVKNSFNHFPVDFLTQTAGIATCRNFSYYMENAKKISAERNDFTKFLREKNWFVIESRTNFVFAKKIGRSGKEIYEAAKNSGVLIRHFDTAGIGDFVRITIGTAEQMQSLKKILSAL
jgi:histidinol-phosphate aminotransferase